MYESWDGWTDWSTYLFGYVLIYLFMKQKEKYTNLLCHFSPKLFCENLGEKFQFLPVIISCRQGIAFSFQAQCQYHFGKVRGLRKDKSLIINDTGEKCGKNKWQGKPQVKRTPNFKNPTLQSASTREFQVPFFLVFLELAMLSWALNSLNSFSKNLTSFHIFLTSVSLRPRCSLFKLHWN